MNHYEHLTGRSQRLFDRGIRRSRSPLWFLRPDINPSPVPGPSDQRQPSSGSAVVTDDDGPEAWRI